MRILSHYAFPLSQAFLAFLFLCLWWNYADRFEAASRGYAAGKVVNLEAGTRAEVLSTILQERAYLPKKQDADYAASHLISQLNEGMELGALYELREWRWQVPAAKIDSARSPFYWQQLQALEVNKGIDAAFTTLEVGSLTSEQTIDTAQHGEIRVSIAREACDTLPEACQNVVVRLSECYADTLAGRLTPMLRTVAYLKSDGKGEVVFRGLVADKSYCVLPIRRGFDYGSPQGSEAGSLAQSGKAARLSCKFRERELRMPLFTAEDLGRMRDEGCITIRTPEDYRSQLVLWVVLVLVSWILLYVVGKRIAVQRRAIWYPGLLTGLMLLTGMSMLGMFSFNNPLTDRLLGVGAAEGVLVGVFVIGLVQLIDFKRFYARSRQGYDVPFVVLCWVLKPMIGGERVVRLRTIWPKGLGWLVAAGVLTLLLFTPLGHAVGGARVNLQLGFTFQPSELAKLLSLLFMAAYFTQNHEDIAQYSQRGNLRFFRGKVRILLPIVVGLLVLMLLYLLLKDMGPALVVGVSFILLYAFIKSHVALSGEGKCHLERQSALREVLTCDLAMLLYGVGSFVAFLVVGYKLGNMWITCLLWFGVWGVFWWLRGYIFESAMFFNLVVTMFVFGGWLLGTLTPFDTAAERLDDRLAMCSNPWGELPLEGQTDKPGVNGQLASGLWALASGGLFGQGLGEGATHTIPAFHTDMVLTSLGEQLGFLGLLLIVLLMAYLVRKALVVGYRSGNAFTFFLCASIGVTTGVQFLIISLGSVGLIPLTGVTVPLVSSGMVGMIVNLTSFGIVLSVAQHTEAKLPNVVASLEETMLQRYDYPVSLLSILFSLLGFVLVASCFYYQYTARDSTLIRPLYVHTSRGKPMVAYNPRINMLERELEAGDIYDRHGVLLATSRAEKLKSYGKLYNACRLRPDLNPHQQRYYPFGRYLYFSLADYNRQWNFSDNAMPRGYQAEARHLSELRGYDNKLYDQYGEAVQVSLTSEKYSPGRFLAKTYSYNAPYPLQLRNYKALLPYLKAGVHSSKVERLNERSPRLFETQSVYPRDLHLTLDAVLQTRLAQQLETYMAKHYGAAEWHKVRASIVILDAQQGDLLASAVYPLPDMERLQREPDQYDDRYKDNSWRAYSDMDLGLVFPTAPGSTIKVVSAMAGFTRDGQELTSRSYTIDKAEVIRSNDPTGEVDLAKALQASSNCYFINLVNDTVSPLGLYPQLAVLYAQTGVHVKGIAPYVWEYRPPEEAFTKAVEANAYQNVEFYRNYKRSGVKHRMNKHVPDEWGWSWGQHGVEVTPLVMARVFSAVINRGEMPPTHFVLKDDREESVKLLEEGDADWLAEVLAGVYGVERLKGVTQSSIGGKTGTASRNWYAPAQQGRKRPSPTVLNDGWFVFYIDSATVTTQDELEASPDSRATSLAVAVRIERLTPKHGSADAIALSKAVVLPTLKMQAYIE